MRDGDETKARRKLGQRDGVFKRNGWWCIDYYDADGKRHRKKAAPDYETAKIMYRQIKTAIARGEVLGVREEGVRVREFVDKKYWPTVSPTLSRWEQLRARSILDNQIVPTFGATKLSALRQEAIERWQAARLAEVSGATANKELMRLKHMLNRAVAWGYLKRNPSNGVRKAKEAPGRVRYLTAEERDLLLSGVDATVKAKDGRTWVMRHHASPALRLYIVAALQTGARRGELLNLRWADVDFEGGTVTFRRTKNGERRV